MSTSSLNRHTYLNYTQFTNHFSPKLNLKHMSNNKVGNLLKDNCISKVFDHPRMIERDVGNIIVSQAYKLQLQGTIFVYNIVVDTFNV